MYKLKLSRHERRELLKAKWVIIILVVLGVAAVIWLAWIRPVQRERQIDSFGECRAAGYPIQESYPEVCLTPSGKRFVNPEQAQAHQESVDGEEELVPPSNPALLFLDIDEWAVRVPLTMETFDLVYNYIEDDMGHVNFTYKRLINANFCTSDIGLDITRSLLKRDPPFDENNPAPIAQAGRFYFYPTYAKKPCYKADDAKQVALVKQIAGDQTLAATTKQLLSKLEPIPE